MVKGRSLQSFGGLTVVSNYPMRERTSEELAKLQYAIQQREIEEMDSEIRKKHFPPEVSSYSSLVGKMKQYSVFNEILIVRLPNLIFFNIYYFFVFSLVAVCFISLHYKSCYSGSRLLDQLLKK